MYKTGVIGDRESILGFMALGFGVFEANDANEAARTLKKLANDDYAVIFIVDDIGAMIPDEIDKYKSGPTPAVILIPGKNGSNGAGLANIKKSVERAVGADILK